MPLHARDTRVEINSEERAALLRLIYIAIESNRELLNRKDQTLEDAPIEKDIAVLQGFRRKIAGRRLF